MSNSPPKSLDISTSDDDRGFSTLRAPTAAMPTTLRGDPSPATERSLPPEPSIGSHALSHALLGLPPTVIQITPEDVAQLTARLHRPEAIAERTEQSASRIDSETKKLEQHSRVDRDLRATVSDEEDEQSVDEKPSDKSSDKDTETARLEQQMRVGQCDRCLSLPIKTHRKCFQPSLETIEWAKDQQAWLSSTLRKDFKILDYVKCTDDEWDLWWTINERNYYASKAVWNPEKIRRDVNATRKEIFEDSINMTTGPSSTSSMTSAFHSRNTFEGYHGVGNMFEGLHPDSRLFKDLLCYSNIARDLRRNSDTPSVIPSSNTDVRQSRSSSIILEEQTASSNYSQDRTASSLSQGPIASTHVFGQPRNGSRASGTPSNTRPDQTPSSSDIHQGRSGSDNNFSLPRESRLFQNLLRTGIIAQDLPHNGNIFQGLHSDHSFFQDFHLSSSIVQEKTSHSNITQEQSRRRPTHSRRASNRDSPHQAAAAPSVSNVNTPVSSSQQDKAKWNIRCLR